MQDFNVAHAQFVVLFYVWNSILYATFGIYIFIFPSVITTAVP
jgi:hypothetical protein